MVYFFYRATVCKKRGVIAVLSHNVHYVIFFCHIYFAKSLFLLTSVFWSQLLVVKVSEDCDIFSRVCAYWLSVFIVSSKYFSDTQSKYHRFFNQSSLLIDDPINRFIFYFFSLLNDCRNTF